MKFAQYRKWVVTLVALLGVLVSNGVLTGSALNIANIVISAGTSIGVWWVTNEPMPGAPAGPTVTK
jgi:hypothetical protein